MRTTAAWVAVATLMLGAPGALAGDVPCSTFGVDGLCRADVDLAFDFGGSFYDLDMTSHVHIFQSGFAPFVGGGTIFDDHPTNARKTIEVDPETLQYGLRASGGLRYERWGLIFEPAMAFSVNDPAGAEKQSGARDRDRLLEVVCCPSFIEWHTLADSEVELEYDWDLTFGPMISIPSPVPWLGRAIVFFPFMGVAEAKWRVDLRQAQKVFFDSPFPEFLATAESHQFEETYFVIGFDIDFPLPGSHGPFHHDLVFGFQWHEATDSGEHLFSAPTPSSTPEALGLPLGRTDWRIDGIEGYRFELRYRVTWNDFSGFFRRNIFGPAE